MIQNCLICCNPVTTQQVTVRSGKTMDLLRCQLCYFEYFNEDPTSDLINNKLDESRLQAAGLDIPTLEKDFGNGMLQSKNYINEYIEDSDKNRNILEIGCSWGYFLKQIQSFGALPFGIELNKIRKNYVENQLKIPCYDALSDCQATGIKFKKIFLFYVLEYIPKPLQYIQQLLELLESDGKIIFITPNLQDPLKDLLNNSGFKQFFYDEHAINYFSVRALQKIIVTLGVKHYQITTRQGYSFANHIHWHLTNKPMTTGIVGGDNFIEELVDKINSNPSKESAALKTLIRNFDARYKSFLEENNFGNQIRLQIAKSLL